MKQLFIGTSGWVYKAWAGSFYPSELEKTGELAFYAGRFNTVEINATFYRLPTVAMVKGWRKRSPSEFVFAVKGSRYITHLKRLRVDRVSLNKYFNRVKHLEEKCGPILWQLPPNMRIDLARLDTFLGKLPPAYRHAVEFRHPSWYETAETFDVLRRHRAAHVPVSSMRMPANFTVTADFAYVRFHGLEHGAAHDYTREELRPWAEHGRQCLREGIRVYAYFNNDGNTRAPMNAELFRGMVEARKPRARTGAAVPRTIARRMPSRRGAGAHRTREAVSL